MKRISVVINGKQLFTEPGKTILVVATENGIEIPTLCYHPDVEANHHCGMCVVEVEGEKGFNYACATMVQDGMVITTESDPLTEERKKNLDINLKKHRLACVECVWFQHCKLMELVKKYQGKPVSVKDERDKVYQAGKVVFDQSKCIGCENCKSVCPTRFLNLNERGKVQPSTDEKKDCINCGQCIIHCPVGAIRGVREFERLETVLKDKSITTVVQFAPAVRTSIGEEFGMKPGEIATELLVAGLKQLGFNYVFDTATAADFTTMEESDELIERLTKNERLPAMTSCCPAWVKYVETDYPEFIPNICTSRSPQIMLGGIVKKYWCKNKSIDPKNIFSVSVMPCVAKKFEADREELKIDGNAPVDMVLTTRELARLFKKNKIDLKNIAGQSADNPLGKPSGAGVIYGSSGGVFESALRTAFFKLTNENLKKDAITKIRGGKGIKTMEIVIGGRNIRICVVSGIKNAKKVLEALKKNPQLYDAVEVMACPGGCVGGGGQPLPTNMKIVEERAKSLYTIDDLSTLHFAHENKDVKKVYDEYFTDVDTRKAVLHTRFVPRKKSAIKITNL
jgi:NADP-reducing hydrogenase subunit HndD